MGERVRLYAGFDGGGTRTTCVLCDSQGSVLGVGSGGPSNYHNTGVEGALAALKASFKDALLRSGVGKRRVELEACFGLAGLDSPKDLAVMRRAIGSAELVPGLDEVRRPLVVNDWRTAVVGAFIDDPGVVLIAGTGCAAAAQSRGGGKLVRVGGWGLVVDDRGSAYDIGRDALYAAMRDYDGRGPPTRLLPMIMRELKVDEPQGIIARVYAEQMSVTRIASLSSLVSRAADGGDAVALRILEEKGGILGELVISAASQLGMLGTPFGVAPHGGVFRAGRPILAPLEERIGAAAPRARIVEARLPPACGAVVLLLRRAGFKVDDRAVARMRSTSRRGGGRREAPQPGA
jgi:N-acetylglucosamine kinase-like BadF-type ATPase